MKTRITSIKDDVSETTSSPAFKKVLDSEYAVPLMLWLLVLAGTLVGFTMHMIYIVSLYQQTPISTEITPVASGIEDFPDVTICRSFPILSLSRFMATLNLRLPKFSNRTLSDFINILYGYTNGVFFSLEKEKFDKLYEAVRRSEWRRIFQYLTTNITIQLRDILVSCEFNGLNCDFTDFVRYDDPVFYNCFTFNVAAFTGNYSMSVGSDRVDLKLLMNTITGLGDRDETVQTMARDHTFFIDIHPSNTRPAMSENVVTETPQRMINLDVRRTEFTKMYLPDRPCFQNLVGVVSGYDTIRPLTNFSEPDYYQSAFIHHFKKFTRYDCLNDEWQKLIFSKCGCFSPLSPVSRYVLDIARATTRPLSWCTDSKMMTEYLKIQSIFSNFTIENNIITYFFYYITKNGTVGNIAQEVNNTNEAYTLECLCTNTNEAHNLALVNNLCPSFCFQESYDIEMNLVNLEPTLDDTNSLQIYLAKKAIKIQNILNNRSDLGSNQILDPDFTKMDLTKLAYIDVSYQLSAKSIISETETYPLINLCSNIGSVMGLWIGANILVIAEVVIVTKLILRSLCLAPDRKEKGERTTSATKTDIVHNFVSKTSFNGINHLIVSKSAMYRIFWSGTLLVATAGLAVHTFTVVTLYLSSPISIEMNYNLDTDQYPAITLCPSTIVSSFLMTKTGFNNLPFNWNHLTNWTLRRLITSGLIPMWTSLYQWQRNHLNMSDMDSTTTMDLMLDASIKNSLFNFLSDLSFRNVSRANAYDMFFSCEYSYQDCTFNNFRVSYHPIYKTCFTFHNPNNDDQRLGYPEFMSILVLSNDLDLSMTYNDSSLSLYRGGLFEVHPSNTVATMIHGHPYAQRSRKIVKITKTMDQIVNSSLYLCHNQGDTITLVEEDVTFSDKGTHQVQYNYSTELCQQLRVQDAVIARCHCLSAMLPASLNQYTHFLEPRKCAQLPVSTLRNDLTTISINNSAFVYLNSSGLIDLQTYIESLTGGRQFLREFDCHWMVMTDDNVKKVAIDSCYSACNEIIYDLTINSNVAPFYYQSYAIVNVYNRFYAPLKVANGTKFSALTYYVSNYYLTNDMYNYLSGFDFYFETSQTMIVAQRLSYGIVEMLSDLGGVLGLWFGISVATIFELIELMLIYIRTKQ